MNALLPQFPTFRSWNVRVYDRMPPVQHLRELPLQGGGHAHVQGRTASGDSSGGKNISRPGIAKQ